MDAKKSIKLYCINHNVTLVELAEKMEIAPSYLSGICTGRVIPSWKVARKIEEVTNGEIKVPFKPKPKRKIRITLSIPEDELHLYRPHLAAAAAAAEKK